MSRGLPSAGADIYELLRQAFLTGYGAHHQQHELLPAMRVEFAEFRQQVPAAPSMAFWVAMGVGRARRTTARTSIEYMKIQKYPMASCWAHCGAATGAGGRGGEQSWQ